MSVHARPNFLFIITDPQRAGHLGCYSNAILRTPHLDSIAARGVRFERCYVASPICMPNRAALMTGRMSSLHGTRHNGIELSLEETTFVEVLRAAADREIVSIANMAEVLIRDYCGRSGVAIQEQQALLLEDERKPQPPER